MKPGPTTRSSSVSWIDAVSYCNRLSEREGLEPAYDQKPETAELRQGNGYRLPTEAEWEYACRAGSLRRYSFGDDPTDLDRHAWYLQNSGDQTHPVGRLEPNAFGLFDMHGNVKEWCFDAFSPLARRGRAPETRPPPALARGQGRVLRIRAGPAPVG